MTAITHTGQPRQRLASVDQVIRKVYEMAKLTLRFGKWLNNRTGVLRTVLVLILFVVTATASASSFYLSEPVEEFQALLIFFENNPAVGIILALIVLSAVAIKAFFASTTGELRLTLRKENDENDE